MSTRLIFDYILFACCTYYFISFCKHYQ